MTTEISILKQKAKEKETENKKFLNKLKQKPPKQLDVLMQELHNDTFEEVDCLECANCCKTTSPIVTDKDVERIAKHLKMKAQSFEEKYIRVDEDGDQVFKSAPCTFLAADNYCLIYDVRPKACAEYPHTNRKRFHQINKITLANTFVCPATYQIVEKLKNTLSEGSKVKRKRR